MSIKTTCVVWQLVPYIDARLSAAALETDLDVIVYSGAAASRDWADSSHRAFRHRLLDASPDLPLAERLASLRNHLADSSPQVVVIQGWSDQAAYTTAAWALGRNIPIVILSESNAHDRHRQQWSEWLKRRVVGVCDAALVGGRDHVNYICALGLPRERVFLGHNAVDNQHFARPAADTPPAAPYFLVSNRLVENKNTASVIAAYDTYRMVTEGPPWGLVILGSGPLQESIRAEISARGLEGLVRLEGFRKYHELPALYHGAGAFILASTWEPWGLVVNEAMAAGLPVIVSRTVGSVCELVRHGENGFTFAPKDVAALTAHMLAIAGGAADRLAMGKRSAEIIAQWGPQRFAAGFADAVRLALQMPRRKPLLDRHAVRLLAGIQGSLAPAGFLARRASKQNRQA